MYRHVAVAQDAHESQSRGVMRDSTERSESTIRNDGSIADSSLAFDPFLADSLRNTMHATLTGRGGQRFCAWGERTAAGAAIKGVFLARGQREDLDPVEISMPGPGEEDDFPSAVFLSDTTVFVVWQRRIGGRSTLLARIAHRSGVLGEAHTVSDDAAACLAPSAARNIEGEILITWQDYRNGDADVYAQRFDSLARRIGTNQRINDDGAHALQGSPRLAADNRVGFLVMWPDNRIDGAWKFYYHRLGDPAARNVLIDSAQRKAMTTVISGVCLANDSAVFAWKDYRAGHSNIYHRRADLRAETLSPAQRVNDDEGERWQRLAATDGDGAGSVVVCWEDYRNTEINQRGDIYLQPYGPDGLVRGGNVKVNDRDDRIARKMPAIVMDDDGWYLVVWHQGEEGSFNLMGQWMRYPDMRAGANFCLTCVTSPTE